MGLFTSPHKKIIAKSPRYFQEAMLRISPALEAAIESDQRLKKASQAFRSAVIGRLAIAASLADAENWSSDAIGYIHMTTQQADGFLPETLRLVAEEMVRQVIAAMMGEAAKRQDSN